MLHICANRAVTKYLEKVEQDLADRDGRIVAWGYQSEWLSPLVLDDIASGEIGTDTVVELGTMVLGDAKEKLDLPRRARIVRVEKFGDYYRFDLRLIPNPKHAPDGFTSYPAQGLEKYLVSY